MTGMTGSLAPAARTPGCEAMAIIGSDGTYGFCRALEHHVDLSGAARCLCDHCHQAADGTRHIDADVYFHGHDIVGLRSERQAKLEQAIALAAATPCAPRSPKPAPAPKLATSKAPAKAKPAPKPGLLAFS